MTPLTREEIVEYRRLDKLPYPVKMTRLLDAYEQSESRLEAASRRVEALEKILRMADFFYADFFYDEDAPKDQDPETWFVTPLYRETILKTREALARSGAKGSKRRGRNETEK